MTPDQQVAKDLAENDQQIARSLAENLEEWRDGISGRIDKLEKSLDENTATTKRVDDSTRELVSILSSWKGAMVVMNFVAKLAKPVAVVLGALTAWYAWRAQK